MVSGNPLVSIIMPVYNCERYLAEAIDSILKQTYENWELLVCDDNSSDNSAVVIEGYSRLDKRITFFVNSENRGAAYSRNFLINKSRGEFIALMDADDISDENRIFAQLEFMQKRSLHACGTNHRTIDAFGGHIDMHRNYTTYEQIVWSAVNSFQFCNASLLIKRECIVNIGGYSEALKTESEDTDMLFRFIVRKYKIETLGKFYYIYRLHGQNVSTRLNESQADNSFNNTRRLQEKVLGYRCSDDFVKFTKYYHRSRLHVEGDCLVLFDVLCHLVSAIENKILLHKVNDRVVKTDIARKMFYLFLKHRKRSKLKSVSILLRAIIFCPTVLEVVFENIWKKIFGNMKTFLCYFSQLQCKNVSK